MRVNVTWRDIRGGKAMMPTGCMVALAVRRELAIEYVSVGLEDARFRIDDQYMTVRLPLRVRQKIRFWERFHFALPFSFELPNLTSDAALGMPYTCHQEPIGEWAVNAATALAGFGRAMHVRKQQTEFLAAA